MILCAFLHYYTATLIISYWPSILVMLPASEYRTQPLHKYYNVKHYTVLTCVPELRGLKLSHLQCLGM